MNRLLYRNAAFTAVAASVMLFGASCKTTKKVKKAEEPTVVVPVVKPDDFGKLYERSFTYSTFSGKAQMHYVGNGQDQNFTANIKMEKDKKVWLSVIALGIQEIARAQVTPEKMQAIERLSRSAYDMTFEEGLKKLNAPIEFPMLENLLIGNPIMQKLKIKDIANTGSEVKIVTEKDGYVQTLTYDKNTQNLIEQLVVSEAKKFRCTVKYSDYVVLNGQAFAKTRSINIEDQAKNKTTLLEMDFSKYDLDGALDIQFSIPSNYKMKQL
ncbi:hypothetical protein DBR32_08275 [Taibaiella sp. KBW10]|uniref:DUF4292 domain-containing protein n=1 Tax=Taibaiella sp. KBW10 TaxID=2153357 RepID=UPI000F596ACB|nr:DUF4292 domain-containing protein [Taibaiella sp. KBW10]RQO30716.1 hypothetical protein DBR32_08275 [Taibaiella sp. KBW10]